MVINKRDRLSPISFLEFLCGLGFMAHGNEDEKLKLAFSFYDHDDSGSVTVDELRTLIQVCLT